MQGKRNSLLYFIHDLALNLRGKDFLMQYMKIALIFKRIELESCALAHLKENSKIFKNLQNFIFLRTSNKYLSLFTSVPLFFSPLLVSLNVISILWSVIMTGCASLVDLQLIYPKEVSRGGGGGGRGRGPAP